MVTARDNLNDNTTFMSVEDLYKLSGTKAIPGVKAVFSEVAPTRGTRFNDMRKDYVVTLLVSLKVMQTR